MAVQITRLIDWLSLTFPNGEPPSMLWPHDEFVTLGRGLHGYKKMSQSAHFGVLAQWDGASEMGTHLVFSGDTLAQTRETLQRGLQPVFEAVTFYKARASRIDLAIDIVGGVLTPRSAHNSLRSGKLKTAARKWSFVQGSEEGFDGDTLYLGSRQSEQFVRIYDKNAEQRIKSDTARIRLECELKGMKARAGLETAMRFGTDAACVGVLQECIQWDVPEIRLAFDAPGVALPEMPRKETQTEKWLLTACVPALAKLIRLKPSFHAKFNDAVGRELRRLQAIQEGLDQEDNQE